MPNENEESSVNELTLEEQLAFKRASDPANGRKYRIRTCSNCGKREVTCTKTPICKSCERSNKNAARQQQQIEELEHIGFLNVRFKEYDHASKVVYTFIAPCCRTEQSARYSNIISARKENPNHLPCFTCGSRSRMQNAHSAFVTKYGRGTWENINHAYHGAYYKRVSDVSNKIYAMYETEINPNGYIRSIKTVDENGDPYHQLDHIVSVAFCFKHAVHPIACGSKKNLQMLTTKNNRTKNFMTGPEDMDLLKELMEDSMVLYEQNVPWNITGVDEEEEKRLAELCASLLADMN